MKATTTMHGITVTMMIMMKMIYATSSASETTTVTPALCPKFEPLESHDLKRASGEWYVVYTTISSEISCFTYNITTTDDGHYVKEVHGYFEGLQVGFVAAWYEDEPGRSKFVSGDGDSTADVVTIDTDYDSYHVSYSCFPDPDGFAVGYGVWILSRTPELDSDTLERLKGVLTDGDADASLLVEVDQINCPPEQTSTTSTTTPAA